MATINEQKTMEMKQAEKELLAALAPLDVVHPDLLHYMSHYRNACAQVIFHDVTYTQRKFVEQKLWDAHVKVNYRFKKLMRMYRNAQNAPDVVEYRKIAKRYLTWIKESQRFYRCFIQTLTKLHGDIPELQALALNHKLTKLNVSSAESTERQVIRLSAHDTLIRLGDLSRYREMQFERKTPNWGPAVGYYDLAGAIYPASGTSHHQLAVVARHSGSHLRATYHLYRSLAVEEPHPNARENLEKEFQKIAAALEKGELDAFDGHGSERVMIPQLLLLHARSYKVEDLSRNDDVEREVLSQLAHYLSKGSAESTLSKIVLINIAAQYDAGVRFQDASRRQNETQDFSTMYAFLSFLRLNIRTFTIFLDILRAEFEASSHEESPPRYGSKAAQGTAWFSVIERRILPICRHYSSWLLSNYELVVAEMSNPKLEKDITGFFRAYANTLTVLASEFDAETLPKIEYLLEEDEDTIAFKAFDQDKTARRYYDQSSRILKPNFHVQSIARHHPSKEMLGRIRDLLTDGVELAIADDVPIDLVGESAFVFREQAGTSVPTALPNHQQPAVPDVDARSNPDRVATGPRQFNAYALAYLEDVISRHSSSRSSSVTRNPAMENMVDDLVGSESSNIVPTKRTSNGSNGAPRLSNHGITHTPPREPYVDYGPIGTPPKNCRRSADKVNGSETSYGVIGTATAQELARNLSNRCSSLEASPQLRLPSILNSPFAPHANNPEPSPQQPGQANNYHVIDSSMSSLAEPSSIGFYPVQVRGRTTHSPRNQPSIWNDDRRGSITNGVGFRHT